MKKLFVLLSLVALVSFSAINTVFAQDTAKDTTKVADTTAVANDSTAIAPAAASDEEKVTEESFDQLMKRYFIEGDAKFMVWILLSLILGLALVIERVIYLNLATTNNKKLLVKIETALNNGGIDAAREVCRNTRGPVAGIFYQGLLKYEEGIDNVEKSIVSYGSVLMGQLEKGLSWISLFIALAPMLGFLGTVVGMIQAFDMIAAAGDISPTIVASGIKVALLTTVFGLVVAIILQIFYNYIVSKVDSLVNDMEDSSISMIDLLSAFKRK